MGQADVLRADPAPSAASPAPPAAGAATRRGSLVGRWRRDQMRLRRGTLAQARDSDRPVAALWVRRRRTRARHRQRDPADGRELHTARAPGRLDPESASKPDTSAPCALSCWGGGSRRPSAMRFIGTSSARCDANWSRRDPGLASCVSRLPPTGPVMMRGPRRERLDDRDLRKAQVGGDPGEAGARYPQAPRFDCDLPIGGDGAISCPPPKSSLATIGAARTPGGRGNSSGPVRVRICP